MKNNLQEFLWTFWGKNEQASLAYIRTILSAIGTETYSVPFFKNNLDCFVENRMWSHCNFYIAWKTMLGYISCRKKAYSGKYIENTRKEYVRKENKEGNHKKKTNNLKHWAWREASDSSSWGVEEGGSGVEGLAQIPTNSAWTLWDPVSKTKQRSPELVLS